MKSFSWAYYNPVEVNFGWGVSEKFQHSFEKPLVVTSKGWLERSPGSEIVSSINAEYVVSNVPPNPDFDFITSTSEAIRELCFDGVIALGGGSSIDAAKALCVRYNYPNGLYQRLVLNEKPEEKGVLPLIAVPTTAGTGSEVTPWATIWDMENKKKFSLSRSDLWPLRAVVDPLFLVSAPDFLIKSCSLDALSHSLESLWNINRNPISMLYAKASAKLILEHLPTVLKGGRSKDTLTALANGSLLAGRAFSNTKTAISHALSYPLTAERGVPHGVACSFTLPAVLEYCLGKDPVLDDCFYEIFGSDPHSKLLDWFNSIEMETSWEQFNVDHMFVARVISESVENPRAQNFLFPVSGLAGRWL